MTLRRFPSAIYHCDLPVSSAGAIYSSSVNALERRSTLSSKPPIPAWPDIKRIDQWCCFPGLFRAIYIYDKHREREYDPNMQYVLKHSQVITQEVLNEAIKLIGTDSSELQQNLLLSARWWEISKRSRGLYDSYDIYSHLHEGCHGLVGVMGLYIAFRQYGYAAIINDLLRTIGTAHQLSPNNLRQLWHDFFAFNSELCSSVLLFRDVEETVANMYAIEITDPEFRDDIFDRLDASMYNQGYLPFANAFAEGCKGRYQLALPLMELYTILLLECELSQEKALFTSIAALESLSVKNAEPSLEDVDRWAISAYPSLEPKLTDLIEARKESRTLEGWYPLTLLWGMGNHTEITFAKGQERACRYLFSESLRQQISKICGFTCPLRRDNEPCCGGQDFMRTLWERLPRNYRSVLRPPTCGSAG
jgi:hypothetical protein